MKKTESTSKKLNNESAILKLKKKKKLKNQRLENQYTIDALVQAMNCVGEGKTIRYAADMFQVPKSTLFRKIKGIFSVQCKKGPATVLNGSEENEIVKWIIESGDRGFPITKTRLLDCVQQYLISEKRKTCFKNSRPGR